MMFLHEGVPEALKDKMSIAIAQVIVNILQGFSDLSDDLPDGLLHENGNLLLNSIIIHAYATLLEHLTFDFDDKSFNEYNSNFTKAMIVIVEELRKRRRIDESNTDSPRSMSEEDFRSIVCNITSIKKDDIVFDVLLEEDKRIAKLAERGIDMKKTMEKVKHETM